MRGGMLRQHTHAMYQTRSRSAMHSQELPSPIYLFSNICHLPARRCAQQRTRSKTSGRSSARCCPSSSTGWMTPGWRVREHLECVGDFTFRHTAPVGLSLTPPPPHRYDPHGAHWDLLQEWAGPSRQELGARTPCVW